MTSTSKCQRQNSDCHLTTTCVPKHHLINCLERKKKQKRIGGSEESKVIYFCGRKDFNKDMQLDVSFEKWM